MLNFLLLVLQVTNLVYYKNVDIGFNILIFILVLILIILNTAALIIRVMI